MTRAASLAERLRAHRAAFTLAQVLGCTPREAEAELRRREARLRDQAAAARLADRISGCTLPPILERGRPDQPWMMRD